MSSPGELMTDTTCLICHETESDFITVCKHKYHSDCIRQWWVISQYCPYCRKPIDLVTLKFTLEEITLLDTDVLLEILFSENVFDNSNFPIEESIDILKERNWDFKYDGGGLLRRAVISNRISIVEKLLSYGCDVNYGINYNYISTSLFYACEYGYYDIAKMLLASGALALDSDLDFYNFKSPISVVYRDENVEMFKLLLEYGATPEFAIKNWCLRAQDASDFEASAHKLNFLLQVGVVPGSFSKELAHRFPEILKILLDNGYVLNEYLYDSISKSNIDWINFYLENVDFDVNLRDSSGESPLLLSVMFNSNSLFFRFISLGADINTIDRFGNSVLLQAILNSNSTILDEALRLGADVNYPRMSDKMTVLHDTFLFGKPEIIEKLLKFGAKMSCIDEKGNYPSNYFFSTDLSDLFAMWDKNVSLLEDQSITCNICNQDKCDFISDCNHSFHFKCIRSWILYFGTCPNCKCLMSAKDIDLVFPFTAEITSRLEEEKIESCLMDACDLEFFPLEKFLDSLFEIRWDFAGKAGPYMCKVVETSNLSCLKKFIEFGGNVKTFVTEQNISSLLTLACFRKDYEVVKAILDSGADFSDEFDIALYTTLKTNDEKIFRLLVEHGANAEIAAETWNSRGLNEETFEDDFKAWKIIVESSGDPELMNQYVSFIISEQNFEFFKLAISFGYASVETFEDLFYMDDESKDWIEYFLSNAQIRKVNSQNNKGMTFALIAAKFNETDIFIKFLSLGADVNIFDSAGNSVLYYAVLNMNDRILDETMKLNPNLDLVYDTENNNILNLACNFKNYYAVEQLLKHGVTVSNLNSEKIYEDIKLEEIFTRLTSKKENLSEEVTFSDIELMSNEEAIDYFARLLLTSTLSIAQIKLNFPANAGPLLIEAAKQGNVEVVKRLLRLGVDKDFGIESNYTALSHACRLGHYEVVVALFRSGADILDLDEFSASCRTPLYEAFVNGHYTIAKYLIRNGANGDHAARFWFDGYLNSRPINEYRESFNFLLDFNFHFGKFARSIKESLEVAVISDDFEIFKMFLDSRLSCVQVLDKLFLLKKLNWINYYIEHPNFYIESADTEGNTPIILAAKHNETDLFLKIAKFNPNINRLNSLGHSVIYYARLNKNDRILDEALKMGGNTTDMKSVNESELKETGLWNRIFSCFKGGA